MPSSTQLPSRLREENFRRYETSFDLALKCFPKSITLSIPGLSPRTVAARCRDAMQSHQTFKWTAPFHPDATKRLKVFEIGDEVWLGGEKPKSEDSLTAVPDLSNSNLWTLDELSALALLVQNKRLTAPIVIQQRIGELTIQELETKFNVALTSQEDGTTVIT